MSRIATIFASLLVIFLLGVFYTWPQYQRILGFTAELQERNTELKLKKDYFASVKKVAEELDQYKEEIAKVDSAIPVNPFLPSLFNFTKETAAQNGFVLTKVGRFGVSSSREQQGLREIAFDVSLAGEYSALENLLSALEQSARIIEAENIIFTVREKGDSNPPLELKLKAYSY
ncbi:MAG: hypothetical protein A3H01_01690 [Candidatus Wildermuthbacteria bacterium RIFCSPLOWO2_12_FULL_40_9]|uniref:Uncharacterized protein n=2 Tax=Candidatus Wildermuthiibacteriota TaxID=1817923 RepID=A0A1G2RAX4_9BACT|nr:MAG: hypothetical protein A3F15_01700 [Candidatus Wildermuthbacteria bacterium RIFCSPHIGHO2_12_FULL_40_12]OHA76611.1 MAG: hypothetical protein A3H01_01690 [Candidatus Wildermuthbacteria bacterium RIFCSPLOWO2_12_FULL_40_9]